MGLQVFGDILYTSGNLLTSGSGPRKSTSAIGEIGRLGVPSSVGIGNAACPFHEGRMASAAFHNACLGATVSKTPASTSESTALGFMPVRCARSLVPT